jgi:hypothetical protein
VVIREGSKQGIEDYLEIEYLYMGTQLVRFLDFDPKDATYYVGRQTVIATRAHAGMALWREMVFAMLNRNAELTRRSYVPCTISAPGGGEIRAGSRARRRKDRLSAASSSVTRRPIRPVEPVMRIIGFSCDAGSVGQPGTHCPDLRATAREHHRYLRQAAGLNVHGGAYRLKRANAADT